MSAPSSVAPRAAQEAKTLFQNYFKSVGPRTYAAQLKQAGNGNHFLVLTEGKRDAKTQELRKTRLFVFSEDFEAFFKLVDNVRQAARVHPVSTAVAKRQAGFWKKDAGGRREARVSTAASGSSADARPNRSEASESREGRPASGQPECKPFASSDSRR